jgi:hypothetical protein
MPVARQASQSVAKPASRHEQQLIIVLDRRVALEALLVTALHKSPAARRQEWLRRVLIQGFRAECQGLRAVMTEGSGMGSERPQRDVFAQRASHTETALPVPTSAVVMTRRDDTAKPLAQLKDTIG